MKNILTILAVLLIATTTQAQEFACPLMGWTATAPTGWELTPRERSYNIATNISYFRNTDMGTTNTLGAPPTSQSPPPVSVLADPKDYQGITIKRTEYNYIVIETHRAPRKALKNTDVYNTEREEELTKEAKDLEAYRDVMLMVQPISDTERIADRKFYALQLNVQQSGETALRIYTYRWYYDKYELHATIVCTDLQYLQEMRNILTTTANSITIKK